MNNKSTLELGTKPVGKLLVEYAFPAIMAMIAASLYHTIDSIFIGQGVGAMAISGLAITFPFMNLLVAFGAAIGVGASSILSVKLGQKDYSTAECILGNSFTLNIIVATFVAIVGLLFLEPILEFFGASEHTMPYAKDYMKVVLYGNIISQLFFGTNALLRAMSMPKAAMYITFVTVIVNIMLAPLFIYVFKWGIIGAATATVISEFSGLSIQLYIFLNKKSVLTIKRKTLKIRYNLVKNIISIGMSPFSMNVCACIIVIFINKGFVTYGGDISVGAYGIANRIMFLFVMITFGINQGMQPIIGYNYGAKNIDRVKLTLKYAIIGAVTIMCVGWIVGQYFSYQCAKLFTTDKHLVDLAAYGMKIDMFAFPLIGVQMVITYFFQSIGKAKISIFLSLSRQLIFLLPLLIILPKSYGVDGVWYSLPISDAIAFVVAIAIMIPFMRKFNKVT